MEILVFLSKPNHLKNSNPSHRTYFLPLYSNLLFKTKTHINLQNRLSPYGPHLLLNPSFVNFCSSLNHSTAKIPTLVPHCGARSLEDPASIWYKAQFYVGSDAQFIMLVMRSYDCHCSPTGGC